jgi:Arc/MetJ family transcription regulator
VRTTLIIDDELLARARELSGLKQAAAIVAAGLRALIAREAARRLSARGGTARNLKPVTRRRARRGI